MTPYQKFLDRKSQQIQSNGISSRAQLHPSLFGFQADIVRWAIRKGRAAALEGLNRVLEKQSMHKDTDTDENGEPLNAFAEMLRVMDIEHLIRFRRRLEKVGRKRMVEILTEEIQERQALERTQATKATTEAAQGEAIAKKPHRFA